MRALLPAAAAILFSCPASADPGHEIQKPRVAVEFDIDELFPKFGIPMPHATPADRMKALYESEKTTVPTKDDLVGIWMGHGFLMMMGGRSVQNFLMMAHDAYRIENNAEVSDFMIWAQPYGGDTRDDLSLIGLDRYRRMACVRESFGTRHSNRLDADRVEFKTEVDPDPSLTVTTVATLRKLGDTLIMKEMIAYQPVGGEPAPQVLSAYAVFFKRAPIPRKIVCGDAPAFEL